MSPMALSCETPSVFGFGRTGYYDSAIPCLCGEADPATYGREGLRSLEILIASYLSARGTAGALPRR